MSGKRNGRGSYQGLGDRGRGRSVRGYIYYGDTTKHKGLFSALGNHVFDYGQKSSADQMRTTWEKLVHHVRTIHGHNFSKTLLNKKTIIIKKPKHIQDALDEYQLATRIRDQSYQLSSKPWKSQKGVFEDQVMEA